MDNKQQMIRALKSIEYLTEYYIRRFFAKQNIVEDFMEETGFGEENCLKYAELVDSHFQELKINILMHDVEELRILLIGKDKGKFMTIHCPP